jgi:hypothetical protein
MKGIIMRLLDLMYLYDDYIKRHPLVELINKYKLNLIVDESTFDSDDIHIVADHRNERLFIMSGLHDPLGEWLGGNLPNGYEVLYTTDEDLH